jgi:hypothetical protein
MVASAVAEFLSRRRSCERIAEALVRWSTRGGRPASVAHGAGLTQSAGRSRIVNVESS